MRREINPRTLKKSSDYRNTIPVAAEGAPQATTQGVHIPGISLKSVESDYEIMEPHTSTDTVVHPKKDKIVRVMRGSLYVITQEGTGYKQKLVPAGTEAALERGTVYRLATADLAAELFICQSSKYTTGLQVVEKSKVKSALSTVPQTEPVVQRPRTASKAKEQALQARTGQAQQTKENMAKQASQLDAGAPPNMINARPTGGHFSDDDAG